MSAGIVKLYNTLHCRVFNVGANDLALGAGFIQKMRREADFPFLSANILDRRTGELVFRPYKIIKTPAAKIGFIGVTKANARVNSVYKFDDPVRAAQPIIDKIRSKVDIIILLASVEDGELGRMTASLKGVDFAVSSRSFRLTNQPKTRNGIVILQSGTRGKYAGVLHIKRTNKVATMENFSTEISQLNFTQERLDQLAKAVPKGMTSDEYYADDGAKKQLLQTLNARKIKLENLMHAAQNSFWFAPVALDKTITDDPDVLMQINELKQAVAAVSGN